MPRQTLSTREPPGPIEKVVASGVSPQLMERLESSMVGVPLSTAVGAACTTTKSPAGGQARLPQIGQFLLFDRHLGRQFGQLLFYSPKLGSAVRFVLLTGVPVEGLEFLPLAASHRIAVLS